MAKLVRDKIPEIIEGNGEIPVVRIANNEEYGKKLKEKLVEEVQEYFESESFEELADILEVVHALCDYKDIPREKLESIRAEKAEKRGAFKNKIILIETKKQYAS
ncbi:MAG: hypothetical protein UY41_C0012G0002 [Candidatus Moranbacteria bacterium GW2011_GWE1_49_15]|nr:MAG: hypothetical protein UX75_C0020G0004 [Candidatus Moranbacteria bacterium GW2011_GWE2_47_10]KKW06912.1 MAG: hypothetical protein UY41_C0012G0002 [Candidatus Moranbacteria bacterium GW2011_GWE1_49_15]HBP01143.1 hypothetical protein [Candidatus Moranbacteria bacterium]